MKLRWRLGLFFVYPMAKILFRLKVFGREKLQSTGGKIIAANHTSNFDPILLGLATKDEVCFLAKEELFKFRKWFSWLIRTWNAFPVRRRQADPSTFKTCSELLQKKKTLILFPEGTRNAQKTTKNLLPFKPGVGFLAVTNQVPVVPCYIEGVANSFIAKIVDSDLNPSKLRLGDFFSSRITIRFGNPIPPDGWKRKRSDYEKFTLEVQNAVARLAKWE
uniref:1-acyl-sn-glycerol-3-phosphate acyltransferase n=1 Tax=candidate division WOR-3 bacterium TaxID=2052148 RepID=A0A7C6A994_UNCW3